MLQVGCAEIVARVVEDLKDESEPYRRMVMETTEKVIRDLGTAEIDARLEELLIDGILYAFQEQVSSLDAACLHTARHRRLRWAGARAAAMHHPHLVAGVPFNASAEPLHRRAARLGLSSLMSAWACR